MAKRKNPAKKRAKRRNPAAKTKIVYRNKPKRKAAKRIARRSITGLNFKTAAKNILPTQVGMFAAKYAAKRFPGFGGPATETDPNTWGYGTYIKGSIGATLAAMGVNLIKPGYGQKVLEGGLNLMVYELGQNEFVAKSAWGQAAFGQADYFPEEYLMTGTDDYPEVMGRDGNFYPADERHRLPETQMGGGQFAPVDQFGDVLQPVGPLGATGDRWSRAFVH